MLPVLPAARRSQPKGVLRQNFAGGQASRQFTDKFTQRVRARPLPLVLARAHQLSFRPFCTTLQRRKYHLELARVVSAVVDELGDGGVAS